MTNPLMRKIQFDRVCAALAKAAWKLKKLARHCAVLLTFPDMKKPELSATLHTSSGRFPGNLEAAAQARPARDQILQNNRNSTSNGALEARAWTSILNRYRAPSTARSVIEIAITALPLVLLWIAMWALLHFSYWLTLLVAVPAAAFLVRLFMIQHDCGHGSFFRHRLVNDWVGRVAGVLTLTPYDFWRQTHAVHHATSGNLDLRGVGDIDTITVDEYLARSRFGRLMYRLYRHPVVMFGIGPAYLFILQHRLPVGLMKAGWRPWLSTMATNAAIALIVATLIWFIGLKAFLLVQLPITLLAGSIGVWLF